ncbi:hypothetical protein ALC57_11173 [Trachymyrmex cornetzi]|uniref:Uncharacterized protein n=1 Tax=Trachymyrmex cornetzi TaxID=471704 RepID=A0A195DVT2_9HYME|nr:hypothetical protein ALC57_11173 [Trachymyrmex cornetzi]
MTFRCVASNGGFFALPCAVRDEKFPFDLIAVDLEKKAQICAITSDTQSIHHSCHCSFCGDETAIHSKNRTCPICGRTCRKSYERDTCQINRKQFVPKHKSGIESIEPCGNTTESESQKNKKQYDLNVNNVLNLLRNEDESEIKSLDSEDEFENQPPTQNVENNVAEDLNDIVMTFLLSKIKIKKRLKF